MTTVKLSVALGVLLSASFVTASPAGYDYELPPEKDITDPPSLASEDREDLREYLTSLEEYYEVRHWDAVADEYFERTRDTEEWPDYYDKPGRLGTLFRNMVSRPPVLIEDWERGTRRWVRAPLRPEDDPWIFETAWRLLAEDPVDWETLRPIAAIQYAYVEYDPRWTEIAEYLLELPLVPQGESGAIDARSTVQNAGGWRHFIIHWPENASETLAKGVTLPYQPEDRRIMPPAPEASAEAIQERERHWASEIMETLDYRGATPEELAEVAEHIEADVEAGAYELDAETEEWLERIRQ